MIDGPIATGWIFGSLGLAIFGYAAIRILALVISQRARLELADRGERFLAREDVSEADRAVVTFGLDQAFRGRWMIAGAFALPPFTLLLLVVWGCYKLGIKLPPPKPQSQPQWANSEVQAEFFRLVILWFRALAGNSPLAALFCLAFIYILWPIFKPIQLLRRYLPTPPKVSNAERF